MKILVVGEFYSSNLGDAVICESTAYILSENFPNVEVDILDFSGRKKFSIDTKNKLEKNKSNVLKIFLRKNIYIHTFKMFLRKNYPDFKNLELDSYDGVILAGGQLIMGYFLCPLIVLCKETSRINKPLTLNSVGYGKLDSFFARKTVKSLLNEQNIQHISVRDHQEQFTSLTNKNIYHTPDPAIFAAQCYDVTKNKKATYIGLGIMYIDKMEVVLKEYWKNVINELNRQNKKWSFFVNGSEKDYEFAEKILIELGYPINETNLRKRPILPIDLIQIIASFERIMSFRLHSHIIAYSLKIPSVALSWDNKVNSFFEMIDKNNNVFNYTDSDITKMINVLLNSSYNSRSDQILFNQLKQRCIENMTQQIRVFKQ